MEGITVEGDIQMDEIENKQNNKIDNMYNLTEDDPVFNVYFLFRIG